MKKILVTGGTGLIGRALQEIMPDAIYLSSKDCDLTRQHEVINLFFKNQFTHVVHLAATVSGIEDNMKRPYSHYTENVLMNTILLEQARKSVVKCFIGILSTCAYQDESEIYPLTEEMIFNGKPPAPNFPYGIAKRAMAVQIEACNKEFGTNYQYMIPCNIYGRHDKYNPDRSHYVGALIKKIFDAKISKSDNITLFGSGNPLRQFIYADDVAKVIKYFIDNDITTSVNVANDEVYSIDKIARIALNACDAKDINIIYDKDRPDGQFRKDCSNEKLKKLMPELKFTPLEEGIKKTYEFYKNENS